MTTKNVNTAIVITKIIFLLNLLNLHLGKQMSNNPKVLFSDCL